MNLGKIAQPQQPLQYTEGSFPNTAVCIADRTMLLRQQKLLRFPIPHCMVSVWREWSQRQFA
jgi:hypothetical protein